MIVRRTVYSILVSVFLISGELSAQYYFEVTPAIEDIYQSAWEMSYEDAYKTVQRVKKNEPNNLLINLAENYIDFLRIFLTDDMRIFDTFKADVTHRLNNIRMGDPASPYYYYSQAEIYIQWSLVRSKKRESVRAGWDINRANKLLKKCKEEHPDFVLPEKSLSVIHALMGSVKGIRRTFIRLFTSLDGSVEQGIEEIGSLYLRDQDNPGLWSDEIITVLSLMQGHLLKNWDKASDILDDISDKRRNTPLGRFLIGSTAYYAGNNEKAISVLVDSTRQNHSFYYLDLLAGSALLNKLDPAAATYFKRYLDHHHGDNFLKSACQKMAWYEWVINNNPEGYDYWMLRCLTVGTDQTGEDQQALLSAKSKHRPDRILLISRLLFDGGYYGQALAKINQYDPADKPKLQRLEYTYRKARILQKLERHNEALVLLGQTINLGRDQKEYYACNAALQMAYIFYADHDDKNAHKYADLTLDIHPEEHKEDLHQEAKVLKERAASR